MSTPDNNELKERERCAWASVADGWQEQTNNLCKTMLSSIPTCV